MSSLTLEHAGRSDAGQARARNEDAVRTEPALGLFVVADGMGGHPAGDVASALAVEEVADRMAELEADVGFGPARTALYEAVAGAGRRILEEGRESRDRLGMGTTCTALLVRSGRWAVANVGDSRTYRLRDGDLEQVSVDHSAYPGSSTLTRALGTERDPTPDMFEGTAHAGDVFLLCSDGLMRTHSDEEIAGAARRALEDGPEAVVDRLVEEANDRGAPDNVTVVVVALREGTGEAEGDDASDGTRPFAEVPDEE